MDSIRLPILNNEYNKKGLLLFIAIYVFAFISLFCKSFFGGLLSYIIQLIYIVFTLFWADRYKVTLISDNVSSYHQSEKNYKIIFVSLSSIAILLDTFLCIADGSGWYRGRVGGIIGIMTFVIWYAWGRCIYEICMYNLQKEYNKSMANLKAQRELEFKKEQIETKYNNDLQKLFDKYGECTTDVCIGDEKKIKQHIYVFENSATIVLCGEGIAFKKILGFTLQDDSKTIMTSDVASYTSTTKTSTGSMLGRAAVGSLFGGVGALVGASTAKKETITTPNQNQSTTTTSIKHNYICYVNVNDLTNPIREIFLGENSKKAQMIANIFNVIIERNKS